MQGPLFDPDDHETFTKVGICLDIKVPAAFDTFIESRYGINFVTLSACAKAIRHLFVNSRLKLLKLQKVDVHPCCMCKRYLVFDIDTTRFPLLHLFVDGYCKPHTNDTYSDSATGYYKLQRNKEAMNATVFAYWFLKPIVSKDIAKIICQEVLYAPRETPCQEELSHARSWQPIVEKDVKKLKTELANVQLELFRIMSLEKEMQEKKAQLNKQLQSNQQLTDLYDKVFDFTSKVLNKKQKH